MRTIAVLIAFGAVWVAPQDRDLRPVPLRSDTGGRWALVIGVDQYEDSAISPLRFCGADAKLMARVLSDPKAGGFPASAVVLLTNDAARELRPTRANILSRLRSLTEVAGPDDTVVFYFSGHGIEEAGKTFLLPSDARIDAPSDTGIDASRVRELMERCKARKKVLVFDACHSGSGKSAEQMSPAMATSLLAAAEGTVTFASCDVNQRSYEWDEKGHGVFTYYFAEGLKGAADREGDGVVTADELKAYVDRAVRQWSVTNGKLQVPRVVSNVAGDLPLSWPGPAAPLKSDPPETEPPKLQPRPESPIPSAGLLRSFDAASDVIAMALSPDGNTLATAGQDNVVRLWDLALGTMRRELKGHLGRVNGLAFTRDGARLASASQDLSIRIWNARTGNWVRSLTAPDVRPVECVAFSTSGVLVYSGHSNGEILVWDARSGSLEHRMEQHTSPVTALALTADGVSMASASNDQTVLLWHALSRVNRGALRGHTGKVFSVAYSPGGETLASAGEDGSVRLWSAAGSALGVLEGHKTSVRCLAFSADGTTLASGDAYGKVILWDVKERAVRRSIDAHAASLAGVAFLPKAEGLLTAGQDRKVAIWTLGG